MPLVLLAYYEAYKVATPKLKARMNRIYGGLDGWFVKDTLHALSRLVADPNAGAFNLRNNIRQGDTSQTPLQFVYEAADCRFFYTAEMYASQEKVWEMAYKLVWQNETCVHGSTGQISSAPGTGYILSPPPASAKVAPGSSSASSVASASLAHSLKEAWRVVVVALLSVALISY